MASHDPFTPELTSSPDTTAADPASTTTPSSTTTTTIPTTRAGATTTTPPVPRQLEETYTMDNFQNDYTEDRSQSLSSQSRPKSTHPNPQVIVSAGVPMYQDPRPSYGYHGTRGITVGGNFHRVPSPPAVSVGAVTVRVEEICLVLVVLMLWAGAITLFINRWGKLRMLEPYQPAYTAPVVPPRGAAAAAVPPPVGPCINIQSTSDLTLTEGGAAGGRYDWGAPENYGRGSLASGYLGMDRSPSCLSVRTLNPQRKVKSAVDLVSLVMQEKMSSSVHLAATNV